jgi:hypothetical protein
MRTAALIAASRAAITGRPSAARVNGRRLTPPRYGLDLVDRGGNAAPLQLKSRIGAANDPLEHEADRVADAVMSGGAAGPVSPTGPDAAQRSCAECAAEDPTIQRKCAGCEEEAGTLQRQAAAAEAGGRTAPAIVDSVVGSPGQPLEPATRDFMSTRFGADFGNVRIHADARAAQSAAAIHARAYTVGRDIVFGAGEYDPGGHSGRRLLAHELAHVRQQAGGDARVQRTPASKVSCANNLPLRIPGQADVADPVAVITAAEDRANEMFDAVIDSLDFARQRIIAGAPAAWPTVSDALATGLQLMGLDPADRAIWTAPAGTGTRSVPLLLRRLRLIRGTIGAGSFFFFCNGTGMTRMGNCTPPAGDAHICVGAEAATCAGEFFTAFCPPFWAQSAEMQAATLIHESAHNFATFIGHTGRFTNAECFARLVQMFAGVDDADQRLDLCPNP